MLNIKTKELKISDGAFLFEYLTLTISSLIILNSLGIFILNPSNISYCVSMLLPLLVVMTNVFSISLKFYVFVIFGIVIIV